MKTPSADQNGNVLLTDSEFERLHMMEPEEFSSVDEETLKKYVDTLNWHREQRVSGGTGDVGGLRINGMTVEEFKEHWRMMNSQRGK